MELEKLNAEYGNAKEQVEKLSKIITQIEADLKKLQEEKNYHLSKISVAKYEKNASEESIHKAEVVRLDGQISKKLETINRLREILVKNQDLIEDKMKMIAENPEFKAHLKEVLTKKYSRKIAHLSEDKKKNEDKLELLGKIKEIVKTDVKAQNSLRGFFETKQEVKILLEMIKSLTDKNGIETDPAKCDDIRTRIAQLNANSKDKHVKPFIAHLNHMGIEFKDADFTDLIESMDIRYSSKEHGRDFDFDLMFNKKMKTIQNENKGIDKQVKQYTYSLEKMGVSLKNYAPEGEKPEGEKPEGENDNKPKWWQFIKRFKAFNERRKQAKLPASTEKPEVPNPSEKSEFVNSLKYEIVNDYVEKLTSDNLKEAKKAIKSNKEEEQEK